MAERSGYLARSGAFFSNRVQNAAATGFVDGQLDELARIQTVHCRPTILALSDIHRAALKPSNHQAKHDDEMPAVADALSLIANIVMAWNTAQMQKS
jgi:hypothetical protein